MKKFLIALMSTTALGTTMLGLVPPAERRHGIIDWSTAHG